MKEIIMPQFGETVQEEITITQWLKGIGDEVRTGDALLEIQTDKATLTVEAADSGRLLQIIKGSGQAVRPGTVIGFLEGSSR
jgi:pyruvate/2-oxoglutarate dehydrogenase complex dihydrolipoamide acyltransferase (E2) component